MKKATTTKQQPQDIRRYIQLIETVNGKINKNERYSLTEVIHQPAVMAAHNNEKVSLYDRIFNWKRVLDKITTEILTSQYNHMILLIQKDKSKNKKNNKMNKK